MRAALWQPVVVVFKPIRKCVSFVWNNKIPATIIGVFLKVRQERNKKKQSYAFYISENIEKLCGSNSDPSKDKLQESVDKILEEIPGEKGNKLKALKNIGVVTFPIIQAVAEKYNEYRRGRSERRKDEVQDPYDKKLAESIIKEAELLKKEKTNY